VLLLVAQVEPSDGFAVLLDAGRIFRAANKAWDVVAHRFTLALAREFFASDWVDAEHVLLVRVFVARFGRCVEGGVLHARVLLLGLRIVLRGEEASLFVAFLVPVE